jgi:hypothetical protein
MGMPGHGPDAIAQAIPATAGPAEPVPVAILARTSTLLLQDPMASLRRQIRSCQEWLPAGWRVTACYWDVESGGIDLDQRGHSEAWRAFAEAGIPGTGASRTCSTRRNHPRRRSPPWCAKTLSGPRGICSAR